MPAGQETCQRQHQSMSIVMHSSYKNLKTINCGINEIRSVTIQLGQSTIARTITERMHLSRLCQQLFRSWPFEREFFDHKSNNGNNLMCAIEMTQATITLQSAAMLICVWGERTCEQRKWADAMKEVHLWRIRADLCNTHDSNLALQPMAVPIAITFYTAWWSYLHFGWLGVSSIALDVNN